MNPLQQSKAWGTTTAAVSMFNAFQTAAATLIRYSNAYTIPFIIAANYFNKVETKRFWTRAPEENLLAYWKLGTMNLELIGRSLKGDMQAMDQFLAMEMQSFMAALADKDPEKINEFSLRMLRLSDLVAYAYPSAIDGIQSEFGFHFERQPASSLVDETDRFLLYQVLPTESKVQTRPNGKPIMIIPPFVLGANILAFLPMEKRSYAHAFANQGFPTYIRVAKDIQVTEAVQVMTPEDDARDSRRFCETIKARHGMPLTLNGYCQGGYTALCNLLSGELDGLVDAFITCVAPMDGSRGKGLASFLQKLPGAFNDLAYGAKTLSNGNQVADGTLMGWVYKLKSIETETPLLAMWRDMMLLSKGNGNPAGINKTAAALNHWLIHDRNDLAMNMTRVSFDSFNTPIAKDGTLPVRLFDRPLNLKRLQEKNIPWLICYGKQDDLVEPDAALAPIDFVKAEVTGFPKGHVAIATSWSHPDSAYALHQRYPEENTRGPVCFQLDLQAAIDEARKPAPVVEKPAPQEPVARKLITEEPVTEKPVAQEPVARKTVAQEGKTPAKNGQTAERMAKEAQSIIEARSDKPSEQAAKTGAEKTTTKGKTAASKSTAKRSEKAKAK